MADFQTSMTPETQAGWRDIVTRAWSDDEFKQKLIDDPHTVLADAGLPVSEKVNYVIVENEPQLVHLVLPARPGGDVSINHMTDSDYDPGF
jgi:Nitrile hydratase, alpha chain